MNVDLIIVAAKNLSNPFKIQFGIGPESDRMLFFPINLNSDDIVIVLVFVGSMSSSSDAMVVDNALPGEKTVFSGVPTSSLSTKAALIYEVRSLLSSFTSCSVTALFLSGTFSWMWHSGNDFLDVVCCHKIIKEVRTFTNFGLKEAKDWLEKAPTLLMTKEEAEKIIEKMKKVGVKAFPCLPSLLSLVIGKFDSGVDQVEQTY
ncbi:Ribosomal protein L7/L12, C-terminal [Dillenia turbinata]|uniref:Ribosomal protein L7/L12, C-terminal n=1 Tax=Dillenia turbinata TaxID=194707 RepID=A0AAN8UUS8_9MAGN